LQSPKRVDSLNQNEATIEIPEKIGSRILLLLTLALVFLGSLAPTGTGDFFMNLALGRLLFTHGTLPPVDPFLFTIPGYQWHVWHEWLSYAYYFKLHSAVGYGGIIVVRALWLTLFAYILWRFGRAQQKIPAIVLAPVLLIVFTIAFERCRVDRACFFGDLLVAGLIMVLLTIDRLGEWRSWIWFLPLGFVFWVNWHGSFPLGWFFLGAYIALRFKDWDATDRKRWLTLFILCILATTVNPLGIKATLWPLNVYHELSRFKEINSEWLPFYSGKFELGMKIRVGTFLAVGLLFTALGLKRKKYFEFVGTVVLIYACFSCIRFVGIAAFSIGAFILQDMRSWEWTRAKKLTGLAATPLLASAVLFLNPGYGAYWPRQLANGHYFLNGVAYSAVKHMATLPPGNIFNEYDMGGLLAWELNGKMRIAGHGHIHQATLAIDHYWRFQQSPEDFRDIIGKGDVEYFIALKSDLDATPGSGWVQELNRFWLRLYDDGDAVIFKRIFNYKR
jgi:hypothetical protein